MPNPNRFKNEKEFMAECMHQTLHLEKKDRAQAIAQCLSMWSNRKKKKCVAEFLRELSATLITSGG
jgi:hemerythrin